MDFDLENYQVDGEDIDDETLDYLRYDSEWISYCTSALNEILSKHPGKGVKFILWKFKQVSEAQFTLAVSRVNKIIDASKF